MATFPKYSDQHLASSLYGHKKYLKPYHFLTLTILITILCYLYSEIADSERQGQAIQNLLNWFQNWHLLALQVTWSSFCLFIFFLNRK